MDNRNTAPAARSSHFTRTFTVAHVKDRAQEYTGVVSKVYGAYYNLLPEPERGPEIRARLRGRLRLARGETGGRRHRHLIMVGDRVVYTRPDPDQPARIQSLLPRRNALCRAVHQHVQALGANLDRAVIMISLASPEPNFRFLDRVLVSCHAEGIEPLLVFSKRDLVTDDDPALEMVDLYARLGYRVFPLDLSAEAPRPPDRFAEFVELLSSGQTVIVGRSGTGKSTLCNRLLGGVYQKTDGISSVGKGRHTTTNSSLFVFQDTEAFFIDTPGVKEWGVSHVASGDVLTGFPELRDLIGECQFSNCEHRPSDLGCALQAAIQASIDAAEAATHPESPPPLHPERVFSLLAMLAHGEGGPPPGA